MYINTRTDRSGSSLARAGLSAQPGWRAGTDFDRELDCALRAVRRSAKITLAFDHRYELVEASRPAREGAYGWLANGFLTRQARRDFSLELAASRDDLDLYGQALCQLPDTSGTDLVLVQLRQVEASLILARVPESVWPPQLDCLLARVYELTPTEVEIMRGVFECSSVEALAKQRRRTVRTIRTQLSAIYAKTGLKSQADIVRLIAKLAD